VTFRRIYGLFHTPNARLLALQRAEGPERRGPDLVAGDALIILQAFSYPSVDSIAFCVPILFIILALNVALNNLKLAPECSKVFL